VPALDDEGRRLVEQYMNVATGAAWRYWRRAPAADVDELRAVACAALVQGVARFPDYQREHGYPLDDHRYLVAFLDRRVKGALYDWARGQDWLTRSQRQRVKLLEAAAEDAGPGADAAGLAAAAGLAEDEARDALAAQAAGPMHLDPLLLDDDVGRLRDQTEIIHLRDQAGDVESTVVVGSVLAAVTEVISSLPWPQLGLLVAVYLHGLPVREYAEAVGISKDEAHALHKSTVLEIHDVMLGAVSEGGCRCGRAGSCGCTA